MLKIVVLLMVVASALSKCPKGNTECASGGCISTKHQDGECCRDDPNTGCGVGYICASSLFSQRRLESSMELYCQSTDNSTVAPRIPRYQQCSLAPQVLNNVYGFPIQTEDNRTAYWAYYATQNIWNATNMARIIIMVHGSGRNADDYLCCTSEMADNNTLVIAPWILAPGDGDILVKNPQSIEVEPLYWAEFGPIFHTWRYGADDTRNGISSYQALDALLEDLHGRFQDADVVVAGHSAGGQYTQRWALLSSSSLWETARIRVVVANPKSFCFLDERRFLKASSGSNSTIFRRPTATEKETCRLYNNWEWGFSDDMEYLTAPYKDRVLANMTVTQISLRYAQRSVIYLAGAYDLLPNGNCMANLQGHNRFERSKHFIESLDILFPHDHSHVRWVVPQVPHDHCLMFQSELGQEALYGDL